jgi:flagellar hook-basal body complex protein FliE
MDIKPLIGAASAYARAKPATAATPIAPEVGAGPLARGVEEFTQVLRNAEDTAMAAMTGRADPHSLVQALAQTERAVETAVVLRDKVVEAYQEILRMPV